MLYVVVQDIYKSIKLKHILVFNDYKYVFFYRTQHWVLRRSNLNILFLQIQYQLHLYYKLHKLLNHFSVNLILKIRGKQLSQCDRCVKFEFNNKLLE